MKKFKTIVALLMACLVMFTAMVAVTAPENVMATGTEPTTGEKETGDVNFKTGDANDIKVQDVITESAGANGVAGIGFRSVLQKDGEIISVRPKMDTGSPFVVDNAMHEILTPDPAKDESKSFFTGFVFNVKGDVKTGYYPIAFEIEYKMGNDTYRVDKSIDIALFGIEEETTTASDSQVSVPRIIVTGFETNPEQVMAGEEFELTIHLQNTSNRTAVSNVKVSMSTANNEFLPASGSSTEFVRSISCGATKDIVIKMKAQGNLEQKPYVLTVACDYEGEKNAPYQASESISIPVYQEAKAKITDVEVMPESIEVYGQANVMFSINNTGKSPLYNVQVSVDKNNPYVQSDDSFVGNIQPGSTGYADFMVNGIAPTMDDGVVKIIISYEDSNGEVGTFEQEINLFVYEPYVEDPGMMGDPMFEDPGMMMEEEPAGVSWIWIAVGIAVVVVVVIVTVVVIKNKKRKALEEELEDEIS